MISESLHRRCRVFREKADQIYTASPGDDCPDIFMLLAESDDLIEDMRAAIANRDNIIQQLAENGE